MVKEIKLNAQEWLNKYFSNKSSSYIFFLEDEMAKLEKVDEEEESVELKLVGEELIIDNYPYLEKIYLTSSDKFLPVLLHIPQRGIGSIKKITVSNCPFLEEITLKKLELEELVLKNVPSLKHLDVSSNNLTELDLRSHKKLTSLNTSDNALMKPLFLFSGRDIEVEIRNEVQVKKKFKKNEDSELRNILLIGRVGSGKSTLANVLSGTNNFAESGSAISKTHQTQKAVFEVEIKNNYFDEKIKYGVIDTIGTMDDKSHNWKYLSKEISKTCWEIRGGLNQIFFVVRGKFAEEEWKTYELLKENILDEDMGKYTTIIRTDFKDFEDAEKCAEETKLIKKENLFFYKLLKECGDKIIYVDNPSLEVSGSGKRVEIQKNLYQELREVSRGKLLKHLILNSIVGYQSAKLNELNRKNNNYLLEVEKGEKKVKALEESGETETFKSDEAQVLNWDWVSETKKEVNQLEAKIEVQTQKITKLKEKFNQDKVCKIS